MALVVLLEDEPVLRSSMARGLSKLPGVTVVEAGTVQAALDAIDAEAPQMVISDIDLPDRSGLELLGELGRRKLAIPILFVSAYLKAYGALIPPHANVDVREKPIDLEDLRAIVRQRLAQTTVSETPFGPSDYIQLACLGHRSVLVDVEAESGRGFIIVYKGVLHTASDQQGEGEDAFRRLVFLPGAAARVRAFDGDPGTRTIHRGWEAMLLDAARELDERARDSGAEAASHFDPFSDEAFDIHEAPPALELEPEPEPAAETGPESEPPSKAADDTGFFTRAFDRGVTALLSKDYRSAFLAFTEAASIRPGDPKTLANLKRLQELGHGD